MMINPFYEQSWFTIILAGVVGVFTFIGKDLWTKRKERREKAKEVDMMVGLKSIRILYEAMEQIMQLTNVDRVLLLEVSNSGNIPKAGEKIYSRAIEVKLDDVSMRLPILSNYEQIRVDQAYIHMVIEAKETQDSYKFDVETHPDCLLKRIYEQEGVKYAEVYHVHSDTNKWKQFIVSVSTFNEGERFADDQQRAIISNSIHRIRQTFELII